MQQRHRRRPAGEDYVGETRLEEGSSFTLKLVSEGDFNQGRLLLSRKRRFPLRPSWPASFELADTQCGE